MPTSGVFSFMRMRFNGMVRNPGAQEAGLSETTGHLCILCKVGAELGGGTRGVCGGKGLAGGPQMGINVSRQARQCWRLPDGCAAVRMLDRWGYDEQQGARYRIG